MSALGGAIVIGLALTAEEVIVTSKGGAGAVSGFFGVVANAVQRVADPTIAAIPDLADKGSPTPAPPKTGGGLPGSAPAIGHTTPSGEVAPYAIH